MPSPTELTGTLDTILANGRSPEEFAELVRDWIAATGGELELDGDEGRMSGGYNEEEGFRFEITVEETSGAVVGVFDRNGEVLEMADVALANDDGVEALTHTQSVDDAEEIEEEDEPEPEEEEEEPEEEKVSLGEGAEAAVLFLWQNSPEFYDFYTIASNTDLGGLTVGNFEGVVDDAELLGSFFADWEEYYEGVYTLVRHPEEDAYAVVLLSEKEAVLEALNVSDETEGIEHMLQQLKDHLRDNPKAELPVVIWEALKNGDIEGDAELSIFPNPGTNMMLSLSAEPEDIRVYYDWFGGKNPRLASEKTEPEPEPEPERPKVLFGDFQQAIHKCLDLPADIWEALQNGELEGTKKISIDVVPDSMVVVTVHKPDPKKEKIIITYFWNSRGQSPRVKVIDKKKNKPKPKSGLADEEDTGEKTVQKGKVQLFDGSPKAKHRSLDQLEQMMLESVNLVSEEFQGALRKKLPEFWKRLRAAVEGSVVAYEKHVSRDEGSFSALVKRISTEIFAEDAYEAFVTIRNLTWLRVCNIAFEGTLQDHVIGAFDPTEDDCKFVGRMIGRVLPWQVGKWDEKTEAFLESLKGLEADGAAELIQSDLAGKK